MSATSIVSLNPNSFAVDLLKGIGISKPSQADVMFIERWETAEGGNWNNSAVANPLNTSELEPGSTSYKSGAKGKGVQRYTSWASGLAATIKTLKLPAYSGIVSGLKDNSPAAALTALQASPWDKSHYPNGLPTSAAAAAYVKAHGSTSGGKSLLQQAESIPGKLAGSAANDVGGAISSALTPLVSDAKTGLTYAGFAAVGLVLIVGGLLSMTKGSRQKVSGDVLGGAPQLAGAAGGSGAGGSGAGGSGGAAGAGIPPEAAAALA